MEEGKNRRPRREGVKEELSFHSNLREQTGSWYS